MSVMIVEFPKDTPGLTSGQYDTLFEALGAWVTSVLPNDITWDPHIFSVPTNQAWRSLADNIPEPDLDGFPSLTTDEHLAMWLTARLAELLINRIAQPPDFDPKIQRADAAEIAADIHRLQYRIMAQAASRLHPGFYRAQGLPL